MSMDEAVSYALEYIDAQSTVGLRVRLGGAS
jgi:hypothetical protein